MLHIHDRAAMARALTLDLDPRLMRLLAERIAALATPYGDLADLTEFLVVEPGDGENDIVRAIGMSPLVDPVSGVRFGEDGFRPGWDWLSAHDGWFELNYCVGDGGFAYVLLVSAARAGSPLVTMLENSSGRRNHDASRDL